LLESPDWLGKDEHDWSRFVISELDWLSVLTVLHEVSELEVEDFDGTEEAGEDSREYCKSDIEFGRALSRFDFCRMNLASL